MIHVSGSVPTGAGIFSPHFLQQIVKSHCRVSGRLNTKKSIGEQKANIQACKSLTILSRDNVRIL